MIIDFRVRPSAKSFLNLSIYTQPDWVESFFRFFGPYKAVATGKE